jgi:PleD family two-component response regulator
MDVHPARRQNDFSFNRERILTMQSQGWEIDNNLNFHIEEGHQEQTYYRLLIVHDDLSVIGRLTQLFPKERFEILVAYDGLDALQKVRSYILIVS